LKAQDSEPEPWSTLQTRRAQRLRWSRRRRSPAPQNHGRLPPI